MAGKAAPLQARHDVVEGDACAHVRPLPDPVTQRVQERHRLDEVGTQVFVDQAPFVQSFRDEAEVELFEVSQTSVDQLAGPAG